MKTSLLFFLRSCATALMLVANALPSQDFRASSKSVAQMADAALDGVLTPEFIRLTAIEERTLRFDRQRTMAAFGANDDATPLATLGFRRSVNAGSKELLEGCNQAGVGECTKLIGSTYVHLAPVSMSDTNAIVWLHFVSAAKGSGKRAFMSTISTQVHLARAGAGAWRFVRTGLSSRS
ncbi:hypothetical protein [Gemmatimonas sp.]|jgi:hypothetical protein|uniref:hypothetical protein n=1 Tax=Gemmatimonas sp. TaxID=1962908 RepID=UPI0037C0B8BE